MYKMKPLQTQLLQAKEKLQKAAENRAEPVPGQVYKHFKGQKYTILAIAKFSENHSKKLVIYKDERGHVWARPYKMFMSPTDFAKYPQILQPFRFELIEAEENEHDKMGIFKK